MRGWHWLCEVDVMEMLAAVVVWFSGVGGRAGCRVVCAVRGGDGWGVGVEMSGGWRGQRGAGRDALPLHYIDCRRAQF